MKQSFAIILFFFLLAIFSCKRPQTYPIVPHITFKNFIVKDTVDILDNNIKKGTLIFSFVDGDGDIGLQEGDTLPPYDSTYFYNLFLEGYYYENGIIHKDTSSVPLYFRIPYVEPQGQNKVLKGDIKVDIIYNYPILHDSIYYKFYMVDRALHKSNIETTSLIVLE